MYAVSCIIFASIPGLLLSLETRDPGTTPVFRRAGTPSKCCTVLSDPGRCGETEELREQGCCELSLAVLQPFCDWSCAGETAGRVSMWRGAVSSMLIPSESDTRPHWPPSRCKGLNSSIFIEASTGSVERQSAVFSDSEWQELSTPIAVRAAATLLDTSPLIQMDIPLQNDVNEPLDVNVDSVGTVQSSQRVSEHPLWPQLRRWSWLTTSLLQDTIPEQTPLLRMNRTIAMKLQAMQTLRCTILHIISDSNAPSPTGCPDHSRSSLAQPSGSSTTSGAENASTAGLGLGVNATWGPSASLTTSLTWADQYALGTVLRNTSLDVTGRDGMASWEAFERLVGRAGAQTIQDLTGASIRLLGSLQEYVQSPAGEEGGALISAAGCEGLVALKASELSFAQASSPQWWDNRVSACIQHRGMVDEHGDEASQWRHLLLQTLVYSRTYRQIQVLKARLRKPPAAVHDTGVWNALNASACRRSIRVHGGASFFLALAPDSSVTPASSHPNASIPAWLWPGSPPNATLTADAAYDDILQGLLQHPLRTSSLDEACLAVVMHPALWNRDPDPMTTATWGLLQIDMPVVLRKLPTWNRWGAGGRNHVIVTGYTGSW